MAKKLTNGTISIGAYMFPDRKKPFLCYEEGNQITVYSPSVLERVEMQGMGCCQ